MSSSVLQMNRYSNILLPENRNDTAQMFSTRSSLLKGAENAVQASQGANVGSSNHERTVLVSKSKNTKSRIPAKAYGKGIEHDIQMIEQIASHIGVSSANSTLNKSKQYFMNPQYTCGSPQQDEKIQILYHPIKTQDMKFNQLSNHRASEKGAALID